MGEYTIEDFKGLDVRHMAESAEPDTLRQAVNIDLSPGRGYTSRNQLRKFADVDSTSRGLYVIGDALRCAVPYPSGAIPRPPEGITYDFISNTSGAYAGVLSAVPSAAGWHGDPYLCVQRTATPQEAYEHHYLPSPQSPFQGSATALTAVDQFQFGPALPAALQTTTGWTIWFASALTGLFTPRTVVAVISPTEVKVTPNIGATLPVGTLFVVRQAASTIVPLPFTPGPAMTIAAERVWAGDRTSLDVFYTAVGDPTDWTTINDAGFLPTGTHVDGSMPIRGLGTFKGQLTVFYERNVQVWQVATIDPNTFRLLDNVGGAGTPFPASVANIRGDLIYFAEGGFHALSAVITTGQLKDADVGAFIVRLTSQIDTTATPPYSVWSNFRAQYLCATGSTVWVLTDSPVSGVRGWTTYSLPFEVEAIVEWRERIYVRRRGAAEVWVFDPTYTGEAGFQWTAQFQFLDFTVGRKLKQLITMSIIQEGESVLTLGFDPRNPAAQDVVMTLDGTSTSLGKIAIPAVFEVVQPQFTGTGPWDCDRIVFDYREGNLL